MLHPADPRLDIPLEQLTVAVVAVTELLLPAVTVGLVVQEAASVYVIVNDVNLIVAVGVKLAEPPPLATLQDAVAEDVTLEIVMPEPAVITIEPLLL